MKMKNVKRVARENVKRHAPALTSTVKLSPQRRERLRILQSKRKALNQRRMCEISVPKSTQLAPSEASSLSLGSFKSCPLNITQAKAVERFVKSEELTCKIPACGPMRKEFWDTILSIISFCVNRRLELARIGDMLMRVDTDTKESEGHEKRRTRPRVRVRVRG